MKQVRHGKKASSFLSCTESGFNFTDICFYVYLHVKEGLSGGGGARERVEYMQHENRGGVIWKGLMYICGGQGIRTM